MVSFKFILGIFLSANLFWICPLLQEPIQNKKGNSDRWQTNRQIFVLLFCCLELFLGNSSHFLQSLEIPNLTFRWSARNSSYLKLWAEVEMCQFWGKVVKKWVCLLYVFYLYLSAEYGVLWSPAEWNNKLEVWSSKSPGGGNTSINKDSHTELFHEQKTNLPLVRHWNFGLIC